VVRVTGKETTLAVEIDGAALDWSLPFEARVELAGGTFVSVKLVAEKCTVPGSHAAGLQLTLVLDGALAGVRAVHLDSGPVALEIVIAPEVR
jgi:hypothetical protein